jgi:hypothetical protein
MKPTTTTSQTRSSSTPRRVVAPRTLVVVAGLTGVAGAVVVMFECGALRRSEDAAPGPEVSSPREVSSHHAPSPTQRTPGSRPALPQAAPTSAVSDEQPSARAVNRLVRTQIKVQKYVEEAYPAWRRAHPGQECPRQLIELNEYMEDKDANQDAKDGWGRPLRMFCGVTLKSGAKGFKVVSYGRDGETSEDDIKFEQ